MGLQKHHLLSKHDDRGLVLPITVRYMVLSLRNGFQAKSHPSGVLWGFSRWIQDAFDGMSSDMHEVAALMRS